MVSDDKPSVDYAESSALQTDRDIALDILGNVDLHSSIDPSVERKIVRKIDLLIMVPICVTYTLVYLDKAMLSYAAIFGLEMDLHLVGTDYNWLSSIFYFGYLVFEYPTSFAMQKISVSKWLAVNIFLWGGICMAFGSCNSFSPFAGLRFVLGCLESCATPAILLLTTMWYKVEEQPLRIGIWASFSGVAQAVGGLLTYGIGHIDGALQSWRYQFIIIGAVSSAWGIFMFFFLAENASEARWLSQEEKKIAIERLRENHTGLKNKKLKYSQLREAIIDPKTWLFFLMGVSSQVVNGAVSNFGSLIIKGFGFSTFDTTLLSIPYGFIILISNLSAMYLQRWIPGQQRCLVAFVSILPAIAGTAGIHILPRSNKGGLLACYYLMGCYTAAFAIVLSLVGANIAGSTKRSFVNAMFFVSYCLGNIAGPFSFKTSEAPDYPSGIVAILISYSVLALLLIAFALYAFSKNKKKAAFLNALGEDENIMDAFGDKTDNENVYFSYKY